MKRRIFFDMDGTLALWMYCPIPVLFSPGYFSNLPAMENMCEAVRILAKREDVELFILSAVLGNEQIEDKKKWLRWHLPEIKEENCIFVPYGESKVKYMGYVQRTDTVVDDYSSNLFEFRDAGVIAIKVLNGINGSHGSWKGHSVSYQMEPQVIVNQIIAIARYYDEVA